MNWSDLYGLTAVGKRVEFADIGCGYGGLLINLAPLYLDVCMVGMEIRVKVCFKSYVDEFLCNQSSYLSLQ